MRTSLGLWIWLGSAALITAGGCADSEPKPTDQSQAQILADYAEIDFSTRPSYLPENVIVLTFDDGPDWNNTARVLDVLREKNAKASFFINTENWSNVNTDAPMQELVRRMVREGHELASHSVHHLSLPTLPASRIEEELAGVENTVRNVVGAGAPRMTLFRAPFGEPYQGNDPNFPSQGYQLVAPVVARHAVHIGWAIDSFDYRCPMGDGGCVFDNVRRAIQTPGLGAHGVILMHSVHSQTANALPDIIDYIRANGFELWTTEDVVRARFGRSSAQIVDAGGGGDDGGGDDGGGDDGGGDDGGGDDGGGDDGGGDDGGGDDGGGGDCDAPQFRAGTAYNAGDRVTNRGNEYTCRPWPFSGWCGIGGAYEPGVGWAWEMAWSEGGSCDGGGDDGGGGGDDGGGDDGGDDGGGDDGGGDDGGDLDWHAGNLTWFTSYPDPDSEECREFNGCMWAGYFAFVDGQQSEQWVSQHNIVAVHSRDANEYALKTLRIRQGGRSIDAVVYDMCSDNDCDGCCTENASETGFLIDIESYTRERFGSGDGIVEWACLDCN